MPFCRTGHATFGNRHLMRCFLSPQSYPYYCSTQLNPRSHFEMSLQNGAHIGHLSAVRRPRGEGPALRGLWRERRGGGRPLRPLPDARRQPGGLAAHQGYLSGRSLLPPGHTFYHLATHCAIWSHLLLTGHIFQSISAKAENGEPCCDWVGKGGSGHFVKMVHNGIEYGDMQGRN